MRYKRVAASEHFQEGMERLIRGAAERRVALLCAEAEPLQCHRSLLVARALAQRGVPETHILADGTPETHEDAMSRLIRVHRLPPEGDLLRGRDDVIAEALERQARRHGHRNRPTDEVGPG